MYKVIREFHDLQDCVSTKAGHVYHKYEVGDKYPRDGKTADDARIDELASKYNKQGYPLIEEVYDGTAVDPERMTKAELIDFAKDLGVEVDARAKKESILEQVMTAKGGEEDAE